jgi:hypothetical protein
VALVKLATLLRGRLRLARGRCPCCDSDSDAVAACAICRDYQGPFPVAERTLLRWSWRFEGSLRSVAAAKSESPRAAWARVGAPIAR